jgi:hypothetical protein
MSDHGVVVCVCDVCEKKGKVVQWGLVVMWKEGASVGIARKEVTMGVVEAGSGKSRVGKTEAGMIAVGKVGVGRTVIGKIVVDKVVSETTEVGRSIVAPLY